MQDVSHPSSSSPRPRRGLWRSIAALGAAVAAAILTAAAPPEPDPVPRRWQLDIETGPIRVMTVETKELGPRAYLYMTYTVTNNSGEDLLFAPSFELAADHQVLRSGRQVPVEVTRSIIDSLQRPLVEDQIAIIGQLLQGKENTKEGVVIWPANELAANEMTIYVAGFSGETATVERPDNHEKVVLRKTLMLRLAIPGDLTQHGQKPLELSEPSRWIMR